MDEWNLLHPGHPRHIPYVTRRLGQVPGPVVAVSDWMRAVPDQIAQFVPGDWSSLGTDGFGLSDTRAALRQHFKVNAAWIVLRVVERLIQRGELDSPLLADVINTYRSDLGDLAAQDTTTPERRA